MIRIFLFMLLSCGGGEDLEKGHFNNAQEELQAFKKSKEGREALEEYKEEIEKLCTQGLNRGKNNSIESLLPKHLVENSLGEKEKQKLIREWCISAVTMMRVQRPDRYACLKDNVQKQKSLQEILGCMDMR